MSKHTPEPWYANDHSDMEEHGEDPCEWIGYAWVGYGGDSDGRFQGMVADLDRRKDASEDWRVSAAADTRRIVACVNALAEGNARRKRTRRHCPSDGRVDRNAPQGEPMTIDQLKELEARATKGPWYTVEAPWRPQDIGTWIIAGHEDPHAGRPVVDSIAIDEWPAEQDGPDYSQSDRDMGFISALRNAAPHLIAVCEAAKAYIAAEDACDARAVLRTALTALEQA